MSHPPGQGPPPPWPPQGNPSSPAQPSGRRKKWWYLAAAAAVLAVAGGITAYLLPEQGETEQSRIKTVVADFALAVDRGDTPKMVGLLCLEEAHGITDNQVDTGDRERDTRSKPIPITTSEVRIKGNIASVVVTRPHQKPTAAYLRKEKGSWKMCAPVEKSRQKLSARASDSSG